MLSNRINFLRNARFQTPEWIPINLHISDASWDQCRGDLERVAYRYPEFFPYVKEGWRDFDAYPFTPGNRKDEEYTDNWGCTWLTRTSGIEGSVIHHPLENWDAYETYKMPDQEKFGDRGPLDWEGMRQYVTFAKSQGQVAQGGLPHGFLFLRACDLHGFENTVCDMMDDDPRMRQLIRDLTTYNLGLVRRYVEMGVDVMAFPEDLGTQTGPFLSPAMFEDWLVPCYEELMRPCREAGILTHFHSDGKTLPILDQQIRAGVDIVNPQDLVNGIDELAKYIKGRACIDLDVDRQTIVPYGTKKDIFDLIEEEVRKLGSPQGGLSMIIGVYPPTPPENIEYLCEALRRFRTWWWD